MEKRILIWKYLLDLADRRRALMVRIYKLRGFIGDSNGGMK